MTDTTVRLHITPLTPDLLPSILGPSVIKLASNVSYHSLQTFPESDYGYVNLPNMEADKVKKRLNGATLKGKKVKVEEARPAKRKHADEGVSEELEEEEGDRAVIKKSKKAQRDRNVIEGRELSPERRVKRGWTETKSGRPEKEKGKSKSNKKPQASSKYTEKEELLFRTKVPKNKIANEEKDTKKGKKPGDNADVVHEFKKSTTIPSFLRTEVSAGGNEAVEYKDGEGWVDEAGGVVEPETKRISRKRKAAKHGLGDEIQIMPTGKNLQTIQKGVVSPPTSEDVSSNDESNVDEQEPASEVETESTSSSGSSEPDTSSSTSSNDASESAEREQSQQTDAISSESVVHPLEALFKKPLKPASTKGLGVLQDVAKPSLEVQTAFSFFDQQDTTEDLPPMPMTPFSSQDLRTREIRSAAPTPDTAHPSRMGSVFNEESEEDEELSEMGDEMDDDATSKQHQQPESNNSLQVPQTDFEKQFWEKRGENNRAWKARRRAVLKDKRQRENRSRRPKNW